MDRYEIVLSVECSDPRNASEIAVILEEALKQVGWNDLFADNIKLERIEKQYSPPQVENAN